MANSELIIVLYSPQIKLWKIADFGLTAEGGSTRAPVTTKYARGTGGYRAPELLAKDPKYTYKVDIWALGCILYELSVKKKAFVDDWNVREYYYSSSPSTLQISIPLSPMLESHLSECIREMIMRDPQKRPSITILCPLIQSYYTLLELQTLEDVVRSIPEYGQWKKLVAENPQDVQDMFSSLVDWYDSAGQKEAVVQLLKALVSTFLHLKSFKEQLAETYKNMENWDA
jgi:serine/threonine protein kinase